MDDLARVAVMLLHSHPKRVGASVLVVERIALARRRCGAPERTRPYLERIIQVKARGPRDGRIVSAGWHARVPLARHALRLRCRTAGRHSKEQRAQVAAAGAPSVSSPATGAAKFNAPRQ